MPSNLFESIPDLLANSKKTPSFHIFAVCDIGIICVLPGANVQRNKELPNPQLLQRAVCRYTERFFQASFLFHEYFVQFNW